MVRIRKAAMDGSTPAATTGAAQRALSRHVFRVLFRAIGSILAQAMSVAQPEIAREVFGTPGDTDVVWAHGWGHARANLAPLAHSLAPLGQHTLLDLPGFGDSPAPPEPWGTADYARAVAAVLPGPVVWVGHSFGGKVGLMLAARRPDLVRGLVLIASSGLKRRGRLWVRAKIAAFKVTKRVCPWAAGRFFGSSDYKNAGPMRATFVRVVNEDLAAEAAAVRCPTLLLYGQGDTETPPEIGRRLAALIPRARLEILDGLDHYTVLTEGRHRIATRIKEFAACL
ncbi:MAG: alpha/beta fold hydrolase [Alphaproteobacteria bacterium]|nr:alpha/beta fold hydrolase [Alphaproteobacteria bacterium]